MSKKLSAKEEVKRRAIKELWRRGDLEYKYHSGQRLIMNKLRDLPASARHILLFISRRWGKSFLGALLGIQTAQKQFYRQILIMGPTEKQTKDILKPIFGEIKHDDFGNLLKETKSEAKWKIGRSEIHLAGFDTCIESVRGKKYDMIILEEPGSAKISKEEYDYIIKSVLWPTLMHSRGSIYYMTTASKNADHPVHTITIPKTEALGTFFKFTIEDNPLLTPEQIQEEIEEMGGRGDPAVERELFCNIIRDVSTLAIPKFNREINVKDFEIPEQFFAWVGGDFGGTRDKTVAHLWVYDFVNAKKMIVDERMFDRNTPTSEIANEIRAMEKKYTQGDLYRYIDCPGQIKVDLQNTHNLAVITPTKNKGSFEAGVNQINLACMEETLIIHSRCKFTITTIEHGRFNKQRNDYDRTEDLGHCDALASMAYGLRHANTNNPYPYLYEHRHTPKDNLLILPNRAPKNQLSKIFDE